MGGTTSVPASSTSRLKPPMPPAVWDAVSRAMLHIEMAGGLYVEGVYRVPGLETSVAKGVRFLQGLDMDATAVAHLDVHDWATAVKRCMRLYAPMVPYNMYDCVVGASAVNMAHTQAVIDTLDSELKARLEFLCLHLARVAQHANVNLMTCGNLSRMWGGIMVRPHEEPAVDIEVELRIAGRQSKFADMLLTHVLQQLAEAPRARPLPLGSPPPRPVSVYAPTLLSPSANAGSFFSDADFDADARFRASDASTTAVFDGESAVSDSSLAALERTIEAQKRMSTSYLATAVNPALLADSIKAVAAERVKGASSRALHHVSEGGSSGDVRRSRRSVLQRSLSVKAMFGAGGGGGGGGGAAAPAQGETGEGNEGDGLPASLPPTMSPTARPAHVHVKSGASEGSGSPVTGPTRRVVVRLASSHNSLSDSPSPGARLGIPGHANMASAAPSFRRVMPEGEVERAHVRRPSSERLTSSSGLGLLTSSSAAVGYARRPVGGLHIPRDFDVASALVGGADGASLPAPPLVARRATSATYDYAHASQLHAALETSLEEEDEEEASLAAWDAAVGGGGSGVGGGCTDDASAARDRLASMPLTEDGIRNAALSVYSSSSCPAAPASSFASPVASSVPSSVTNVPVAAATGSRQGMRLSGSQPL